MSESGSSAPKVLVLHGYVESPPSTRLAARFLDPTIDVFFHRYGQNASIFGKRVCPFTYSRCQLIVFDTDFSGRRAQKESRQ